MLGTNGSAAPDQIAPDVARTLLPQKRAFDTCDRLSRHATGIVQSCLFRLPREKGRYGHPVRAGVMLSMTDCLLTGGP